MTTRNADGRLAYSPQAEPLIEQTFYVLAVMTTRNDDNRLVNYRLQIVPRFELEISIHCAVGAILTMWCINYTRIRRLKKIPTRRHMLALTLTHAPHFGA